MPLNKETEIELYIYIYIQGTEAKYGVILKTFFFVWLI